MPDHRGDKARWRARLSKVDFVRHPSAAFTQYRQGMALPFYANTRLSTMTQAPAPPVAQATKSSFSSSGVVTVCLICAPQLKPS